MKIEMESENQAGHGLDLERRISSEIPHLRAYLRHLAPREAEDLLQDVLERALRYRSAFDPNGSLRGWLLKTAFHVVLDFRRKGAKTPRLLGDGIWEIEAPEKRPLAEKEQVDQLLGRLSRIEKEIVLRFHCQDESIGKIARNLHMPEGTVKSHLHRARRKLAHGDEGAHEHA